MKSKKLVKLIIVLVFIVIVVTTAFIIINHLKPDPATAFGEQPVSTVELKKMDLSDSISATGTIASAESRTVKAELTNINVQKVMVSVGDYVSADDSLVEFDQSDLSNAYEEANDNYESAKISADRAISNAKTQLSDAKADYSSDKSKAEKEVDQAKESLAQIKTTISNLKKQLKTAVGIEEENEINKQLTEAQEMKKQAQNTYDNAVTNLEQTKRKGKSNIESAQTSLETAQENKTKTLKDAKKQIETAQKNLEACIITAPIAGIITQVGVTEGDTYSGGTIVVIEDTSNYTVTTSVDEYDIASVDVGQRVVILTEATDDTELEGEITFVAPSTSSSSSTDSSVSGMQMNSDSSSDGYEVKITLNSFEDDRIKLGMTAKCSIIINEVRDVFAVPYDAVNSHKEEKYITVLDDSSSEQKKISVDTGMETDYYVEVSSQELNEGMMVIIPSDDIDTSNVSNNPSDNGFDRIGGSMSGMRGMPMPGGGNMPGKRQ